METRVHCELGTVARRPAWLLCSGLGAWEHVPGPVSELLCGFSEFMPVNLAQSLPAAWTEHSALCVVSPTSSSYSTFRTHELSLEG